MNNRVFKFRAWDIKQAKWIADDWTGIQMDSGRLFVNEANYIPYQDVDNFIVQQFTGLSDKNGKEIYEGDIVKYISKEYPEEQYTAEVYFDKEGYWSPLVSLSFDDGNMQREFYFEVIGNIFENKDLIK